MPLIERQDLAENRAAGLNPPVMFENIQNDFGVPKVQIYLYNTSNMEFNVPRPPNHPHFLVRACPPTKTYSLIDVIEHPFKQRRDNQNFNQDIVLVDGYEEAMKMLNPQSRGLDQDVEFPSPFHQGDDLFAFGCFWSTYPPEDERNIPLAEKAIERLKKTFRKELETMVAVEGKEGPEGARARANNISHAAANFFGQSFSWHRTDLVPKDVNLAKVDCGVCGEKIMPAAKLCVHCQAPTDPTLQAKWLEKKFNPASGKLLST